MALSREEIEQIASRTADEVISRARDEAEIRDFIIGSMMDGGAIPVGGRERKKLPCRGCRIDPKKPLEAGNVMATTHGAIGTLSAQEVRDWCSELVEVPDGRCQRVRKIREAAKTCKEQHPRDTRKFFECYCPSWAAITTTGSPSPSNPGVTKPPKFIRIKSGRQEGSIVSYESWLKEREGMLRRGETPPEIEPVTETANPSNPGGTIAVAPREAPPPPAPPTAIAVAAEEPQPTDRAVLEVIPEGSLLYILLQGEKRGNPSPEVRLVPPPWRPRPVEIRPPPPPHPKGVRIDEEESKRIYESYEQLRAEGYGETAAMKVIADRMGHSLSTIWRVLHREIREPVFRPVTPERLEEVVGLRRMGYTLERIGGMLGYSKSQVLYLLHRAGELMDPRPEIDRLNNQLHAVSRLLSPPVTTHKLTVAALEAKGVADEVPFFWEIAPKMDWTTRFLLQDIHSRALRAADVLRNGVWCLEASEMKEMPLPPLEYQVRGRPMGRPWPISVGPVQKRYLIACGEWCMYYARGIIEGRPEHQEPWEVLLEPVPEEAESPAVS